MYRGRDAGKPVISQVAISVPTAPIAVVGTNNKNMSPITFENLFVKVLNKYSQTMLDGAGIVVQADGRIRATRTGIVTATGYADVAHSHNNAHIGVVFTLERDGVTMLTPRTVHARVPNIGDIGNISGVGTLAAEVGDVIGIAVASDTTGNVIIHSSSLVFRLD